MKQDIFIGNEARTEQMNTYLLFIGREMSCYNLKMLIDTGHELANTVDFKIC